MSQAMAALDAVWKVVAIGLLLGAGLPALFSLGVRQLAVATEPGANVALHKALGWAAFVVVGAAVTLGIAGIVAHGLGVKLFF